ncbi:fibronectin type III domain-containing protein [Lacinutrix cladophorae]
MKKIILLFTISLFMISCGSDDSGDSNNCSKPSNLDVNNLTNTTATLSWSTNVNSSLYQVEYGTLGFSLGTGTTLTVPDTYADVTSLDPLTQYAFYTRVYCNDSNGYSNWTGPFSFVTLESNPYCDDPDNLSVELYPDSVTHEHIDLSWSNGEYGGSEIQYGLEGFAFGSGTTITISSNYPSSYRVDGLNPDTSYDFYIRNNCNESGYSTWVGPYTHSTLEPPSNPNCIDPTAFTSTGTGTDVNNSNYFDFTWSHPSTQNSWEVARIIAGSTFNASTANILATSFDSVRITYGSTSSGQAYDFYLRANCGGTNGYSDWVGPITVTAQ